MSRPLRIEYPGALYHIISRGERKDNIFFSPSDKHTFLRKLEETVDKYALKLHSFALIDNHYHLLIETPNANIVKAVQYINTSYSNWFKSKYNIVGAVFQGRYKSLLIEKDSYLTTLSAYIHLNPVRARLVKEPENYEWSSYRQYMDPDKKIEWLYTADILALFDGSAESYKKFVSSWIKENKTWNKKMLYPGNSIMGSKEFIGKITDKLKGTINKKDLREIPELRHIVSLKPNDILEAIKLEFKVEETEFSKKGSIYRNLLIYGLKRYTDMSLKQIGEFVGLDYAAVYQANIRFYHRSQGDLEVRDLIEKVDKVVKGK